MSEIKIKNTGRPVVIGGRIVPSDGRAHAVDEKALKDFCAAVSGSHVFENHLTIVDEDTEKRQLVEKEAAKAKAINDAKAEIMPLVEADLTDKIGKKFEAQIASLNDKIVSLNDRINILNDENEALRKAPVSQEDNEDQEDFVLDSEKHHIEHRGGGNWFVMDQEEKVYGPLTEEEKLEFEDLLK